MVLDGSEVNIFIAFVAGMVTFFASCLLPLVPTYIAYISGVTLSDASGSGKLFNSKAFLHSVIFTLGFISIFILFGLSAGALGRFLAVNRNLIQSIGGVFFIILGLVMLNVFKPQALLKEYKLNIDPHHATRWKYLNSYIVGAVFGFGWTPCIGPVLAVILFWASQQTAVLKGTVLLLFYGIGLGLPFVIIGLLFGKLGAKLNKASKFGFYINKVAALIIIFVGILLVFNKMDVLAAYILSLAGSHLSAL